jgi:parallel beta-helix repeat protein
MLAVVASTAAWIGNAIETAMQRLNLRDLGFGFEPEAPAPTSSFVEASVPLLAAAPVSQPATSPLPQVQMASSIQPVSGPDAPAPAPTAATAPPVVEAAAGGSGRVFYVDFASGNDGNAGTSAVAAWRHAPGDPAATGGPASVRLQPGDVVRFRGGVAYRGSITLRASGVSGAPIVYSGTGFGTGPAILDGGDPVTSAVPCPSAAACGGASNWQSLWLVSFTEPSIAYRKLYDSRGPLAEAVVPAPADPFFRDTGSFAVVPRAQLTALTAGRIDNARLADAARGQPQARIAIWVQPNTIQERPILSVSGSTVVFDPAGLNFYTNRDSYAAVVGSVRGVTQPGSYALIGGGRAVVFPRAGAGGYFIGSGRRGFNVNGQSHVTIRGFHMLRGTASEGSTNREGVPVVDISGTARNLVIEDNLIAQASLRNGYGAIHLNRVEGLTIRRNRLIDLEWASGIRLGSGVRNAVIEDNRLSRGGRTGIYTGGSQDVVIRRNIVAGYRGQHGNAISAYAASQRIHILGNCVHGSTRPVTLSGSKTMAGTHDYRIRGNILVADPRGTAALHSWGTVLGLEISDNLLLGRRRGAILHKDDQNVTATHNKTSGGITTTTPIPANWTISNNDDGADYDATVAVTRLTLDGCSGSGRAGLMTIAVAPEADPAPAALSPLVSNKPQPLISTLD